MDDFLQRLCLPNRDTGDVEVLVLSQLPIGNNCFLTGDFNEHSVLWDTVQPSDSRGERIEEWIADNDHICSNDGTSTCTNRATGVGSTPDLFVAPSSVASRVYWNAVVDMGSDHLPITIELECEVNATKPGAARPRWNSKGVDWAVFSSEVERRAEEFSTSDKLCVRVKTFNEILRSAARVAVGRTKPRKTNNTPMTPRIKTLAKKKNMLRRNWRTRREEWLEACRETKEMFKKER